MNDYKFGMAVKGHSNFDGHLVYGYIIHIDNKDRIWVKSIFKGFWIATCLIEKSPFLLRPVLHLYG